MKSTGKDFMQNRSSTGFNEAAGRIILPFLACKLLLLAAFMLANGLGKPANGDGEIRLPALETTYRDWLGVATSGDGQWYERIARNGYEHVPADAPGQHDWAYFPGYPILLKISGIHILPALLASSLFAFFGYVFLRMHIGRFFDSTTADASLALLIFFPFSSSLGTLRPEALIFMGWCAALVAWSSGRKNLAIAVSALAVLLKPEGLAILAYFFIDELQATRRQGFKLSAYARLAIPLLPVAAFSIYIHSLTGDPLAWAKAQAAWGSQLFVQPWQQTLQLLTAPMLVGRWGWDLTFVNVVCSFVGVIFMVSAAFKPMLRPAAAFVAAIFLLSFLNFGYWQMGRHLAIAPTLVYGYAALPERVRGAIFPFMIGIGSLALYLLALGLPYALA